jgi:hypothetical protein
MLNKHIVGELFEIAQGYIGGSLEFKDTNVGVFSYEQISLNAENHKLDIICSLEQYSIIMSYDGYINYLQPLTKEQVLELLYFFKETYDNCKKYPNALHNALEQTCYKYKKERMMK